jgi:hypothetical protein
MPGTGGVVDRKTDVAVRIRPDYEEKKKKRIKSCDGRMGSDEHTTMFMLAVRYARPSLNAFQASS